MANDKNFKIKNGILAQRYLQTGGTETAGTAAYNLGAASYDSKSFSVASQDATPVHTVIGESGAKMYMLGLASDTVYQYTLSTAWDISTASYDSKSLSVTSQDASPLGLFFKPDGTLFYISASTSDSVYQYSLSTAWDLSTATYASKSFSVASQAGVPQAVFFKPDGTKMYVSNDSDKTIYQYSLSTAWDVSTASYDSVSLNTGGDNDVEFSGDGILLFSLKATTSEIDEYTMSTAWDLSTATATGNTINTSSVVGGNQRSVSFKDDGSKMYILGLNNDTVYQYSTVAYTQTLDLSTGNYFSFTPSGATTVSFTNAPASGLAVGFSVEIVGDGSAITWPASVKWHLATAPTATATKELYTFVTTDGGTTYYGKKAAEGLSS